MPTKNEPVNTTKKNPGKPLGNDHANAPNNEGHQKLPGKSDRAPGNPDSKSQPQKKGK